MSLTDEERQKLCEDLRRAAGYNNPICNAAAKEIERLAEELETVENENEHHMRLALALAQSEAEPVAWQYRVKQGGWGGWHDAVPSREEAELCVELGRKASGGHLDDYEIRPLYTKP